MKAIMVKSDDMVSIEEVDGYKDLVGYFGGFPEIVIPRMLIKPFYMIVDDTGLQRNLIILTCTTIDEEQCHESHLQGRKSNLPDTR